MNKNAYEIRLEVLSLAHSDCWNTYHEKLNVLREHDQRAMEDYYRKLEGDSTTPLPKPLFNAEAIDALVPMSDSVKARAAELYSFVEG
tara:strand:- start:296 stop:559 length:264 start_codon:yes stop_codon:yes gene_type:complete